MLCGTNTSASTRPLSGDNAYDVGNHRNDGWQRIARPDADLVATGVIEGENIELPLEPGLQDRLSIQIDVVTSLLRGEEPGAIPLIDDNRVKRYNYTKIGPAVTETDLGKLDTVLYESTRQGSNRQSRFWLVPKMEYLAARAEQIRKGKVETVMMLTSFQQGK